MNIYYDTESDYLEIVFGEPTECYYEKIDVDAYARIDEKTGEVKGYAIYNVKKSDSPIKSINVNIPKEIIENIK